MSKQTVVEWLEQEFIAVQNYSVNELGLFLKAKEMEKQQINKAYKNGQVDGFGINEKDDYYNLTFKK